jgi:hypothetical protein
MNELINLGNGQYVKVTMLKGEKGTNIATITKTGTSGLVDTYTVTLTDGSTTTFEVTNGNSIDHVEKTSTVGSVDTYTIYLTDGSSAGTFTVNNAIATVEQNFSTTSENPLMNKTLTNIIAGVENGSTASKTYNQYDIILRNDSLYEVTTTVASGTAWADGVNITEKTLGELIGGLNADLPNIQSGSSGAITHGVPKDLVTFTKSGTILFSVNSVSDVYIDAAVMLNNDVITEIGYTGRSGSRFAQSGIINVVSGDVLKVAHARYGGGGSSSATWFYTYL